MGWVCAGFRVIRNRVIRNVLINTLLCHGMKIMIKKSAWAMFLLFAAFLNFVFVPALFTYQLVYAEEAPYMWVNLFFLTSVFLTSFLNIFINHHKYQLWSQFLKMIVAMYAGIIAFATTYKFGGVVHPSGVISYETADSLYFSVVTWTTLGYGDFQPSEVVRGWAATQALIGTFFTPMFLAAILFSLQAVGNKRINEDSEGEA